VATGATDWGLDSHRCDQRPQGRLPSAGEGGGLKIPKGTVPVGPGKESETVRGYCAPVGEGGGVKSSQRKLVSRNTERARSNILSTGVNAAVPEKGLKKTFKKKSKVLPRNASG